MTTSAATAGKLFQFGGGVHGRVTVRRESTSDVYVISTRDFSTILLQTRGDIPTLRSSPCSELINTTLLICGGGGECGE